eukprot:2503-Heterococcus_DN1.PRE.2
MSASSSVRLHCRWAGQSADSRCSVDRSVGLKDAKLASLQSRRVLDSACVRRVRLYSVPLGAPFAALRQRMQQPWPLKHATQRQALTLL